MKYLNGFSPINVLNNFSTLSETREKRVCVYDNEVNDSMKAGIPGDFGQGGQNEM